MLSTTSAKWAAFSPEQCVRDPSGLNKGGTVRSTPKRAAFTVDHHLWEFLPRRLSDIVIILLLSSSICFPGSIAKSNIVIPGYVRTISSPKLVPVCLQTNLECKKGYMRLSHSSARLHTTGHATHVLLGWHQSQVEDHLLWWTTVWRHPQGTSGRWEESQKQVKVQSAGLNLQEWQVVSKYKKYSNLSLQKFALAWRKMVGSSSLQRRWNYSGHKTQRTLQMCK